MTEEEKKQHRREYERKYRETHKDVINAANRARRKRIKGDYSLRTIPTAIQDVFVNRLHTLCDALGSQGKLADQCGMTKEIMNYYINRKCFPTIQSMVVIADRCGVSLDWLLGRNDTEPHFDAIETRVRNQTIDSIITTISNWRKQNEME